MAARVTWIETGGRTDFMALRGLTEGDQALVLEHWYEGKPHKFSPVVLHVDDTFSQYIEGYEDPVMARWLMHYTFDQGYMELAVWFNATHLWANRLKEIRQIIEQDKNER